MDIEMNAEDISGEFPIWDLKTEGGIVPIMSGEKESRRALLPEGFLFHRS